MFASQLPVLLYPSPPEKGSKEETTLQQPTLHISATKEPSRLPNVEIFKVRQLTIIALSSLFIQNISVSDWLKSPGYSLYSQLALTKFNCRIFADILNMISILRITDRKRDCRRRGYSAVSAV